MDHPPPVAHVSVPHRGLPAPLHQSEMAGRLGVKPFPSYEELNLGQRRMNLMDFHVGDRSSSSYESLRRNALGINPQ